jgi:LysM repeat protein
LVAGVGVTIVLGGVFYFHKSSNSKAKEKPIANAVAPVTGAVATPAAPATPTPVARSTGQIALPDSIKTMVTQTPGLERTTRPVAGESKPANTQVAIASTVTQGEEPAPTFVAKAPSKAPAVTTGNALADGKAQLEAGNLLAGRQILNDALIANQFSDADAQTAKTLIAQANESIIFSPRRFPEDPFQGSYTVKPGDRPMKIATRYDVTWELLGRINGISDPRRLRVSQTLKTIKGPFHAVVSKSRFTLDLYLGSPGERGSMFVRSFAVGLGRHGSTPTGTWMLAPGGKLKNPKWWGTDGEPPVDSGDPNNPLGTRWMALNGTQGDAVGKEGFGLHGTIDPNSMGKEMSHGCIRMVNENVEKVYDMLTDGKSTVIVTE